MRVVAGVTVKCNCHKKVKIMKRILCLKRRCTAAVLGIIMLLTASATSCKARADYIEHSFFAMDTIIEVKLAADTAQADEIFAECVRLTENIEGMLSAEDGGSDISRFNMSTQGCKVSREVGEIFELAALIWHKSGGAFDPTTYPATLLWRSAAEAGELPSEEELSAAAGKRGMELITYDPSSEFLSKSEPWVMLDLGGIGKGYAEAQVTEYLDGCIEYGVLSFGGNITVVGEHPSGAFTIALRDPQSNSGSYGGSSLGRAGRITVAHGSVSVSGGYERYYEIADERYCHILDPVRAMPICGELQSAAVISDNGAAADALSTALFVLDTTVATAELYRDLLGTSLAFEAILVYENEIYITPGLAGRFTAESGRDLHVMDTAV